MFYINNRSNYYVYVKGVTCGDKSTENYHQSLQFFLLYSTFQLTV